MHGYEDRHLGEEVILICGGPSFLEVDHDRLRRSGLATMTLNDGIRTFRSDLWLGTDTPDCYDPTIWSDGHILKFLPQAYMVEPQASSGINVLGFENSHTWLNEYVFAPGNTVRWSNKFGHGARTSMINAFRVLYVLGFRRLYMFGVDFLQTRRLAYHHPAPGFETRIKGNNKLYRRLSRRLERMRPIMEEAGMRVYNCNPDSHLRVFETRHF